LISLLNSALRLPVTSHKLVSQFFSQSVSNAFMFLHVNVNGWLTYFVMV